MVSTKPRTPRQKANAVLTKFVQFYKEYNKRIDFSRPAEVWGIIDLFNDYSEEQVYDVLEYYFTLNRNSYDPKNFCYKFHEILKSKEESDRRKADRKKLLEQTKRLVEEFEQQR